MRQSQGSGGVQLQAGLGLGLDLFFLLRGRDRNVLSIFDSRRIRTQELHSDSGLTPGSVDQTRNTALGLELGLGNFNS